MVNEQLTTSARQPGFRYFVRFRFYAGTMIVVERDHVVRGRELEPRANWMIVPRGDFLVRHPSGSV